MSKLGEAFVVVRASLAPLKRGLASARKMVNSAMKKIARSAIRAGKWAVLAFAAVSAAAGKLAMDAEESENLFEVSMGNMAKATRQWSEEMGRALGVNSYEVRRFVSTFNVMLNSMGLGIEDAAAMSKAMTQLTYDMASFYNLKPELAFLKLQSGISGEIEPLKRLGILVNENTIKTYALTKGIIKEKEQLTEVQKVQARFAVIMQQTNKAQGDLARTAGSATNVLRSLRSTLADVAIAYGTELLPVITDVAKQMRDWLIENKETIRDWGTSVAKAITIVVGKIHELIKLIETGRLSSAIKKEFPTLTTFASTVAAMTRGIAKGVDWTTEALAGGIAKSAVELGAAGRIARTAPTVTDGMSNKDAVALLRQIARNTAQDTVY